MNKTKIFLVFIFSVANVVPNCLITQDCMARIIEKSAQVCIAAGNDTKIYEIAYEPNNKDYVSYSQAVRERIKQKLNGTYKDYFPEGDVSVSFILNSDGSLCGLNVNAGSSGNEKLSNIVICSLRKSAPFPSFPSTLPYNRMAFNVDISFQKTN